MADSHRLLSCSQVLAALLLALPGAARAQSSAPPESSAEPAPTPAPAPATSPTPASQKRSGRLYSWGSVGTTFAYGQTYGSANLGVGYMFLPSGLAPNVEVGYACARMKVEMPCPQPTSATLAPRASLSATPSSAGIQELTR